MIMAEPVLSIRGLRKAFKKFEALKGIDILIDGPGVYGFLGPNGAGKTTTFKLVSGLLRPTAGGISICGYDIGNETTRALANIGVLFDAPAYYPYLTGRQNLEVFAAWSGECFRSRIGGLLSLVGLAGAEGRKVSEYSWGMKRRLGMAAGLLSDPKLLLLDEPTNGLDPSGIADVRKLLPELAYQHGRTVLLSSHRMEEVDQICDKVTIISNGLIKASGSPSELSRGEPWVEVVCSDPVAARKILEGKTGASRIEQVGSDRLRILANDLSPARINTVLVENGVEVTEVARKKESLEDIFFRLTRTGGEDE